LNGQSLMELAENMTFMNLFDAADAIRLDIGPSRRYLQVTKPNAS